MQSCYFFTWNLGGNKNANRAEEAFKAAVNHLAGVGTCIAALQEVTASITMDKAMEISQGRMRMVEASALAKVKLLHSHDLRCLGTRLDARMCGATFGGDIWGGLQVLGVHLESRLDAPEGPDRERKVRKSAYEFLDFWRGAPLVVLGDFNANPHHPDLCARGGGFFALRDRDMLGEPVRFKDDSGMRRSRVPLYNPMWRHLQEKNESQPRGTNVFSEPYGSIPSCVYDQILISGDLVQGLVDNPEIIAEIGGTKLITKRDGRGPGGNPNSEFSDHLPVALKVTIDLEKMMP